MSVSRSRKSRVFTVSFPEALAKQVDRVAREESRNISELFREAFRKYQMESMRRMVAAARVDAQSRGAVTYKQSDVELLVDEERARQHATRKRTA